jgi:predicted regulator of Ras-like GTPase activity (Roadblock/LC7/MglB family)
MGINTQKLDRLVQNFVSTTSEVQGAAVVTPDGLPLASSLPGAMSEERISAMCAAMLSLGDRIGKELLGGKTDRILVQGEEGLSILTDCGQEAVFIVLAGKEAKQGALNLDIGRTVSEIKSSLT